MSDFLPKSARGIQGSHSKERKKFKEEGVQVGGYIIPLQRLSPCLSRLPLSPSDSLSSLAVPSIDGLSGFSSITNSSSSSSLDMSTSSSHTSHANVLHDSYQSSVNQNIASTPPTSDEDDEDDGEIDNVKFSSSRLPRVKDESRKLHRVLHSFRPITQFYAGTPYRQCFNWNELELDEHVTGEWYIVAFRSLRKPQYEDFNDQLYDADFRAHEEAISNGGLLMYWYGLPDREGRNLATCIWESEEEAKAARYGKEHARAMVLTRDSYVEYTLERYILRKEKGTRRLIIEDYK